MQEYEITYLVDPKLDEKKKLEIDDFINKKILDYKGEVSYIAPSDTPGSRRRLNYPIKDQKMTWLGVFQVQLNPNKIEKLREVLRKKKQILRVSILQTPRREEVSASIFDAAKKPVVNTKTDEQTKPTTNKISMKEVEEKIEKALEEEIK